MDWKTIRIASTPNHPTGPWKQIKGWVKNIYLSFLKYLSLRRGRSGGEEETTSHIHINNKHRERAYVYHTLHVTKWTKFPEVNDFELCIVLHLGQHSEVSSSYYLFKFLLGSLLCFLYSLALISSKFQFFLFWVTWLNHWPAWAVWQLSKEMSVLQVEVENENFFFPLVLEMVNFLLSVGKQSILRGYYDCWCGRPSSSWSLLLLLLLL